MRAIGAISILFLAAGAVAAPDGWHGSMKDGVSAAEKSGKPTLVVTMWKEKV